MSGGEGVGGRYLPEDIVEKQRPDCHSFYDSKNAENFVKLKEEGLLNEVKVFDNEGEEPREMPYTEFSKRGNRLG